MGRGDLARVRNANDRRRKFKDRQKRQAEERGEARKSGAAPEQP
jgi:hypothetical protein